VADPNLVNTTTRIVDTAVGGVTAGYTTVLGPVTTGHALFVRGVLVSNVQTAAGTTPKVTVYVINDGATTTITVPYQQPITFGTKSKNVLPGNVPLYLSEGMELGIEGTAADVMHYAVPYEDLTDL
jgi:hypothetical protein